MKTKHIKLGNTQEKGAGQETETFYFLKKLGGSGDGKQKFYGDPMAFNALRTSLYDFHKHRQGTTKTLQSCSRVGWNQRVVRWGGTPSCEKKVGTGIEEGFVVWPLGGRTSKLPKFASDILGPTHSALLRSRARCCNLVPRVSHLPAPQERGR